jgi:hypothetical protein
MTELHDRGNTSRCCRQNERQNSVLHARIQRAATMCSTNAAIKLRRPHLSGAFVNKEPNDDMLSMMLLLPLPAPPAAAEGAAASDAPAGAAGAGENIDVNGEPNLDITDLRQTERGEGGGGG